MATDYSKILQKGESRAMASKELLTVLNFKSTRELRKDIAEARADGQVICTAPGPDGGYFLPETKAEILRWTRTTTRKAASTFAALKSAKEALKETEGQMKISDILEKPIPELTGMDFSEITAAEFFDPREVIPQETKEAIQELSKELGELFE